LRALNCTDKSWLCTGIWDCSKHVKPPKVDSVSSYVHLEFKIILKVDRTKSSRDVTDLGCDVLGEHANIAIVCNYRRCICVLITPHPLIVDWQLQSYWLVDLSSFVDSLNGLLRCHWRVDIWVTVPR